MENKEFINMITPIIQGIELNEKNREFLEYINNPLSFYNSKPEKFGKSSNRNKGETDWQRVLYNKESLWLDMELPIGQYKKESGKTCNKRLDLIGRENDKYILCELKKTKTPGQPFDALLQLMAYYFMIKNNAEVLDALDIHHKSSEVRDENFKWSEIKDNIELWLRANKEFWANFDKNTPKNNATIEIIKRLKEENMIVRLFSENDEILNEDHDS